MVVSRMIESPVVLFLDTTLLFLLFDAGLPLLHLLRRSPRGSGYSETQASDFTDRPLTEQLVPSEFAHLWTQICSLNGLRPCLPWKNSYHTIQKLKFEAIRSS